MIHLTEEQLRPLWVAIDRWRRKPEETEELAAAIDLEVEKLVQSVLDAPLPVQLLDLPNAIKARESFTILGVHLRDLAESMLWRRQDPTHKSSLKYVAKGALALAKFADQWMESIQTQKGRP